MYFLTFALPRAIGLIFYICSQFIRTTYTSYITAQTRGGKLFAIICYSRKHSKRRTTVMHND